MKIPIVLWLRFSSSVVPTDKRTDVCSRPLCSYSGIFSPKKNWFFWDKIFFQNFFWKILTLFYATFQCGRYNVKKIQKKFFLPMKNWKNHPKKLLRIGPDHFFPLTSQGHSPQPKIDFPYHEISGPDICSLICVLAPLYCFLHSPNEIERGIFHHMYISSRY